MPAHSFTPEEAQPLIDFANERHAIYLRKALLAGEEIPRWANPMRISKITAMPVNPYSLGRLTDDKILSEYRFCNVFRELDRVTVWIRENIREPFADHEHLWFMLAIARFINWPPTLQFLMDHGNWPDRDGFMPGWLTRGMEKRKEQGDKVETGAYMIRAESDPKKEWYSWSKQRYVAEIVLGTPWKLRDRIQYLLAGGDFPDNPVSLQEVWSYFTTKPNPFVGWGPFMAGQVVADLRHTHYLRDAPDVGKWAPVGPGSARGLNRLAGRPLKAPIRQEDGVAEMLQLQELVNARTGPWVPPIELHDIQNCLCETDKYLRVKLGEGKPRASYVPGRGY